MLHLAKQNDYPPLFEAVGCFCSVKEKILLLKRVNEKSYPSCWGIPTGKVRENESPLRAIVRELFEETGMLLSSSNLNLFKTFHVINKDMSFMYTIYTCQFNSIPEIKLNPKEHVRYIWIHPEGALRLELIPDLDNCIRDVFSYLKDKSGQLEIFSNYSKKSIPSIDKLELSIRKSFLQFSYRERYKFDKKWYVAFGPPASGKTTSLKAMSEREKKSHFITDNIILNKNSRLRFYLHKIFEEDDRSYFFNFQIEILPLRFWQAIKAPDFSFVDETIFSSLAYSRALYNLQWLNKYEYEAFYSNYISYLELLPIPTNIFYFNCEEETVLKRIKRRSRKHEIFYSNEYVEALCKAFKEIAKQLSADYNILLIDTDKFTTQEIVEIYGPK